MKSAPAPAKGSTPNSSNRGSLWLAIAVVSVAGNIVLAWLTFGASPAKRTAPPAPTAEVPVAAASKPAAPTGALAPYAALGSFVSENNRIPDLNWSLPEFEAFLYGMRASYEGRGYPMDEDAKKLRDDTSAKVQKILAKDRPDPVQEYFKTLREKEHVLQTPSGLHYRITEEGTGKQPSDTSDVLISYSAKLPSGEPVPSLSRQRVHSAVSDLLPGLREGVKLLRVGGKALVYVPGNLSFGNGEWPADVPRGAPIVFFLELHEVTAAGNSP